MIAVRNLSATYGDFALHDVTLDLHHGGCLAILGPSGAGKTLLLETVMGARRPKRGRVMLDGRDITSVPPELRQIAYIPQDLALFPHLSVRENIVFGLRSRGERRSCGDALNQLVAMLGIERLMNRRDVRTLSGGEKQRVALARALIVRPRVLFLDEPFTALDSATRTDLLRSMRRMRSALQTTMFFVTHELHEACVLADEIAIMMHGRIVTSGPKDEVVRRPRTTSVARFLNIRNILPIAALGVLGLPGPAADPGPEQAGVTHAAVRPEDVTLLSGDAQPDDSAAAIFRARLEDLIPTGAHVIAELIVSGTLRLEALLPPAHAEQFRRSLHQEVTASISPRNVIQLTGDEKAHPPGPADRHGWTSCRPVASHESASSLARNVPGFRRS